MSHKLDSSKLVFDRGFDTFTPDEFAKVVGPYFKSLSEVGRTKYLFAAVVEGQAPMVTGYSTDTTLNVTINSRVVQTEKQGGKWAVFRLT
jgi:hypothetical protein